MNPEEMFRLLSPHFTLDEFVKSEYAARHGIDNTPPEFAVRNLQNLCHFVLEPLRVAVMRPVIVTSGYRSPELNEAIGGSENSQHMAGEAADIYVPSMRVKDLFDFMCERLPFDQIIEEFDAWVHVSYCENRRGEKLIARRQGKQTVYTRV